MNAFDIPMLAVLLPLVLFPTAIRACPPAPRVLHPQKGIGHCNGTCHNIACVGYKHPTSCFQWECTNVPNGFVVHIPPPYDTIHVKYVLSPFLTILTIIGICSLCSTAPELFFGILIGTNVDDEYTLTS